MDELNVIQPNLNLDYVYSIERLNEMNLNVFNEEITDRVLDDDADEFINNELDPHIPPSVYVGSEVFNSNSWSKHFSILNWNVVSVPENLQLLRDLYFHDKMPDVVALCETRLSDELVNLYSYSEYDTHVTCRNRYGGGVLLYMHKKASINTDL